MRTILPHSVVGYLGCLVTDFAQTPDIPVGSDQPADTGGVMTMNEADLVSVEVERFGTPPVVLVRVRGELDFGTTPRLVDALHGLPKRGHHLVFDLSGLTFCDSSGLGALIAAYKVTTAGGGDVYLTGVAPTVLAAITVTSLDQLFQIRDDLTAVFAEISSAGRG